MKVHQKQNSLTFGEFIVTMYDAWGKRRAKGMVWLAVNTHLIEFHGRRRLVISGPNAR